MTEIILYSYIDFLFTAYLFIDFLDEMIQEWQ